MHEEIHNAGLLAGGRGEERSPGLDPLDAVLAVAEPRARETGRGSPAAGPEAHGPDGVLVETSVRLRAPGDNAAEGRGHDDYGEFAWPEGYAADPGAVARFVPLAKKLGLSKESAQELAGLYVELDRERHRTQAEFVSRNNDQWLREIQGHPEFGGVRLQRTTEDVAGMLRRFGSPLLTAQIRQMNVQNWPEMFYFLARVARSVGEDCSPSGGPGTAPPPSTAQLLFPGLK